METAQTILNGKDIEAKKALFCFSKADSNRAIRVKFNLWSRYQFPKYFSSPDAPFHEEMDDAIIRVYKGDKSSLTNIAFRGAAKTARTKLFIAYAILNDTDHSKRYVKVLAADITNAKQIVTDVYNMLVSCDYMYQEIFVRTEIKREETMSSFTTNTGVKLIAGTVGTEHRGALQNEARPDWILFEDFETRRTLRSPVITKMIWDNMEEARTSLSKEGSCIYNCNYLSERGNVHKLVQKKNDLNELLVVPILTKDGESAWAGRYSKADIEQMKLDDDDFEGERMCEPSAGKDVIFDRDILEGMTTRTPERETGGFKMFYKFDPSHRYGSGHDVAGGVGLDSSTSVFIDFDTVPCRVVGTYKNNDIKPDIFGHEVNRQSDLFGGSVAAIEKNNHGHATIAICKQEGTRQYTTEGKGTTIDGSVPKEFGWHTNGATKPKMIFALTKAVNDGLLELTDKDLVQECKSYTRNDLMDREVDVRLTTRHFDMLIACAIAWQMKDYAEIKNIINYDQFESELQYPEIGI